MKKNLSIYLIVLLVFAQNLSAAEKYETASNLKASEILPSKLLKGEHYRIDENVMNDGYINTYKIHSDFGIITAVSNPSLKMRLEEIQAIAAMKKIEETDTYTEAVEKAGKGTLDGVKNLVTRPKESISGAVTGIGKMFRMAGEAIKSKPGAGEDSRLEGLIGFSNTKREYAQQFGVDVYSPNPVLQENLEKIAWAGYGGNMSITAVKALIPGGIGLALSVTGSTQLLNDVIAKTPPTELRRMNREKLEKMGIDPVLVGLFLENTYFSPRNQTLIVAAMEDLKEAEDKYFFVRFAILTSDEDVAFFRTRIALMYAAYNRTQNPIEHFVPIGKFVAGKTKDRLIMIAPVDYLYWTEDIARIVKSINEKAKQVEGVNKRQLWLSGTVSPLSRKQLTSQGWKIFEKSDDKLLSAIKKESEKQKEKELATDKKY